MQLGWAHGYAEVERPLPNTEFGPPMLLLLLSVSVRPSGFNQWELLEINQAAEIRRGFHSAERAAHSFSLRLECLERREAQISLYLLLLLLLATKRNKTLLFSFFAGKFKLLSVGH